jgi:UDP-glucuronate 4-epimerase
VIAGKRILITGGSGQVARPVALALAERNEVWCAGRFGEPGVAGSLRAHGIRTHRWDMAAGGLDGLPDDFTHVLHSAVHRGDGHDFDATVEINAVGTARLMTHCRRAEAFLYLSSGAIYGDRGLRHRYTETDPLDGRTPWLPTYPIGKLATEGVVRALAVTLGLPSTIARLNVAYGPYGHGGMPMLLLRRMLDGAPVEVPHAGQSLCNPIHTDDVVRQAPLLWAAAKAPAQIVNWGGDDVVGVQDLLGYLAGLAGVEPRFVPSGTWRQTHAFDNTLRLKLAGPCQVGWRDGLRRTVQQHFPGSLQPQTGNRP